MTGRNWKTFFFDTSIGSLKPVLISPDPLRAMLTFGVMTLWGAPLMQALTSFTNVRPAWTKLLATKRSSLFVPAASGRSKKKFYNIGPDFFRLERWKLRRIVVASQSAKVARQGSLPRGHQVFLGPCLHGLRRSMPKPHHWTQCSKLEVRFRGQSYKTFYGRNLLIFAIS